MSNKKRILEMTEEKVAEMRAKGIDEDAILKPGKHIFKRVSPDKVFNRKESKLRVNICLDAEIVQHFRQRAESPHSAPYQTQINSELRAIMERDLAQEKTEIDATAKKLLEDDDFLKALSEKLKEKELQTA
ncbi:MAG: BrnA antitoxin family protein [Acidobacteriota bacterium]